MSPRDCQSIAKKAVIEKIYKKFDNYRNTNNTPICNGRTVLRFKTLSENNIKDENVVQLIKME